MAAGEGDRGGGGGEGERVAEGLCGHINGFHSEIRVCHIGRLGRALAHLALLLREIAHGARSAALHGRGEDREEEGGWEWCVVLLFFFICSSLLPFLCLPRPAFGGGRAQGRGAVNVWNKQYETTRAVIVT